MSKPLPRRRPPKIDTERMALMRASARHLKDLHRWHAGPPADVKVNTRGIPRFGPPILEQSYCTSPAALAPIWRTRWVWIRGTVAWAEFGESFP